MKISVLRPGAAIPLAIGGLILIALALFDAAPSEASAAGQDAAPIGETAQP